MRVRVLDLDGGVAAQSEFVERQAAEIVPMGDLGPTIRICCSFGRFERFEKACVERCPDDPGGPAIVFLGSGDFHHVSLAFLRRLREPFNLLILDGHPDWVRGAPIMHCGTWLSHALRLPNLRRLFHVGGDLDFDNALRWFAPWPDLRGGRVVVFPAVRRFDRGAWGSVPTEPLRTDPEEPAAAQRINTLFGALRADLARFPLYVSIDKDVMQAADAPVNWDSGRLTLAEVADVLSWFIGAAEGRLAGVDILGDWSRPRTSGVLRGVLNQTEHPALKADPAEAALINGRTNAVLVETVLRALTTPRRAPARRLP